MATESGHSVDAGSPKTGAPFSRRVHSGCMVCGDRSENPWSLGLSFFEDADGWVTADFMPTIRHQGYDGLLHGGMIGTLLDAAMTHCLLMHGLCRPLTAELSIRYSVPIRIGRSICLKARFIEQKRCVYVTESTISRSGVCLARATAKHIDSNNVGDGI